MRLSYVIHSYSTRDVRLGSKVVPAQRFLEIDYEELKKAPAEDVTALELLRTSREVSVHLVLDGAPVAPYNEPQVVRTYELYHAAS